MTKPGKERNENKYSDVLIIGAGIAGLCLGIKIAQRFCDKKIVILSKDRPGESNTRYAQGGIAVVTDLKKDSFQQHIADTLLAGDGLCNEEVVRCVVKEGPDRLKELEEWGTVFDKSSYGLDLGLEGGHSAHRIIHKKDKTGFHIIDSLLRMIARFPNVEILWNTLAVDLLTAEDKENNQCIGATYIPNNSNKIRSIQSSFTVLSTGGIGQIYSVTTNPNIATGDGIAIAYRAGAKIRDMQFVQFHPTALDAPKEDTTFLISEALRGFGAYLITRDGNRFMFKYDKRGEMASRDIVSRAIFNESLYQPVYIDCRHLDKRDLITHFPNIYQKCLSLGLDITCELVPVLPAAHYLCGGIDTNLCAQTSINGLYAIGECARTGLHGANRLASNSLLEALVFAHFCFQDIETRMFRFVETVFPSEILIIHNSPSDKLLAIQSKLKLTMSEKAGIIRTNEGLMAGLDIVRELSVELELVFQEFGMSWMFCETRNLLIVATLVLQQSLNQKENRGTFYNYDNQEVVNPILKHHV
ncbi:MAG TPA: L-aspartate oxidase [Cyclobacteriaceae bacterium]|nr:L-aspartate oxidase [Cyclobacteriaceae bacterium]HRK52629.1 L-aspartate oxidase [Cyclobacteriaceae bacterium]